MLNAIRSINFGWMVIFMGIIGIASGISMSEGKAGDKTFLCFETGCIYIQGISNIAIGILCVGLGIYLILRTRG